MTSPSSGTQGEETWVPWYRIEAGPDGLLILGQDDESFGLDEEDGIEFLCHQMNQLWNEARAARLAVEALRKQNNAILVFKAWCMADEDAQKRANWQGIVDVINEGYDAGKLALSAIDALNQGGQHETR